MHGQYFYDASGQRTKSVVTTGGSQGPQTTTDYTYAGITLQSLSAAQTTGGNPSAGWKITYLHDEYGRPYGGFYLDTLTPEATPVFFGMVLSDRGDVVELLDSIGNPFAAYRYDAWGNPIGAGTNGVTGIWTQGTTLNGTTVISADLAAQIATRQVLRYASYCFDSESGMYYLSCRHYDPATRQFLSKDLSRNDGEQSAYQYCGGNPVGNVDPTGCVSQQVIDIVQAYCDAYDALADHPVHHVVSFEGRVASARSQTPFPYVDLLWSPEYVDSLDISAKTAFYAGIDQWLNDSPWSPFYPFSRVSGWLRDKAANSDNRFDRFLATVADMGISPFRGDEIQMTTAIAIMLAPLAVPGLVAEEVVGASVGAAARGGAAQVWTGQMGEAAVRASIDIGEKAPILFNGRTIIPDGYIPGVSLSEVKNVASLSFTRQLRTYAEYAANEGLEFNLYVRYGADISKTLLNAKGVKLFVIPF